MSWRAADGVLQSLDSRAPVSPYDCKLCRLVLLAPDLQRAILDGRQPPGLNLQQLIQQPIPRAWPDQRRLYGAL